MIVLDVLVVIVIAMALSLLLTSGFRWRHPRGGESAGSAILFLFLILAFAMLAAGAWLPPLGPPFWGSSFFTFFLAGLFVVLVILAVAPPPRRRPATRAEAIEEIRESEAAGMVFGVLFWILLLGLITVLVLRWIL